MTFTRRSMFLSYFMGAAHSLALIAFVLYSAGMFGGPK